MIEALDFGPLVAIERLHRSVLVQVQPNDPDAESLMFLIPPAQARALSSALVRAADEAERAQG